MLSSAIEKAIPLAISAGRSPAGTANECELSDADAGQLRQVVSLGKGVRYGGLAKALFVLLNILYGETDPAYTRRVAARLRGIVDDLADHIEVTHGQPRGVVHLVADQHLFADALAVFLALDPIVLRPNAE